MSVIGAYICQSEFIIKLVIDHKLKHKKDELTAGGCSFSHIGSFTAQTHTVCIVTQLSLVTLHSVVHNDLGLLKHELITLLLPLVVYLHLLDRWKG